MLADRPDDVSVQLLAGRAYLNSAQLARAEEAFTRVLELDPADHYARFALGKALQRQGRLAEAHAQYKMAAAMDPRPEYQEALGEVRARMALGSRGIGPLPSSDRKGLACPADKQACPKETDRCWATS